MYGIGVQSVGVVETCLLFVRDRISGLEEVRRRMDSQVWMLAKRFLCSAV